MPRFVILEHDHPHLHWDLMLEIAGALRTWRLAVPPRPGASGEATPLGDHRIAYLDYEGPVSGNRGTVRRWDRGDYATIEDTSDSLTVELSGDLVRGKVTLRRAQDQRWEFSCGC